MKYTVTIFLKGAEQWRGEINTKSAKEAAANATFAMYYDLIVVRGKTVKRYGKKLKALRGGIRVFKTYINTKPAILLLLGNVPETYQYESVETRDKVYEEILCTPCEPAASAKAAKEPKDTTVSSDETSGSKSGLTFQKISNGSATNVTWQEKLTQSSIGKYFGTGSAKGWVKPAWSPGSKTSPSKRRQTFLATVKNISKAEMGNEATPAMAAMRGQTIEVHSSGHSSFQWYGEKYFWKSRWLDFENVYVRIVGPSPKKIVDGVGWIPEMDATLGQVMCMHPHKDTYPLHYKSKNFCYSQNWLQPIHKDKVEQSKSLVESVAAKYPKPISKRGAFRMFLKKYADIPVDFNFEIGEMPKTEKSTLDWKFLPQATYPYKKKPFHGGGA